MASRGCSYYDPFYSREISGCQLFVVIEALDGKILNRLAGLLVKRDSSMSGPGSMVPSRQALSR